MSEYVCQQCRESVSESASACPHCGYKPGKSHRRWSWVHFVLMIISFLSVIGFPLGLIFFWKARKHKKAAKNATPAVEA